MVVQYWETYGLMEAIYSDDYLLTEMLLIGLLDRSNNEENWKIFFYINVYTTLYYSHIFIYKVNFFYVRDRNFS